MESSKKNKVGVVLGENLDQIRSNVVKKVKSWHYQRIWLNQKNFGKLWNHWGCGTNRILHQIFVLKKSLSFDSLSIAETIKKCYSSLAENLKNYQNLQIILEYNQWITITSNANWRKGYYLQKLNWIRYSKYQKNLMKVRLQASMICQEFSKR